MLPETYPALLRDAGYRTGFVGKFGVTLEEGEHGMHHAQLVKHGGVRGERYKYARYYQLDPVYEEFYDLERHPHEAVNLAQDADYAQLVAEYRLRCDELRSSYERAAAEGR